MNFEGNKKEGGYNYNNVFERNLAKLYIDHLLKLDSSRKKEGFIVLPKESFTLKDGSTIDVSPLFWRSIAEPTEKEKIKIVLLALDKDKKIQGYRTLVGSFIDEKLIFSGNIMVNKEGNGLASTLDELNNLNLQKIANRYNLEIIWEVSNQGLEMIKDLEASLQQNPRDQFDNEMYQKKVSEQSAWKKIYGEGGKLGFLPSGKNGGLDLYRKTFSPEKNQQGTSNIQILDPIFLNNEVKTKEEDRKFIDEIKESIEF